MKDGREGASSRAQLYEIAQRASTPLLSILGAFVGRIFAPLREHGMSPNDTALIVACIAAA